MWFRVILFALIIYVIYFLIKYIINPKRKLELAQEHNQYYFYDDSSNVRKNFLLTYKGVLFEGEKYLGTTNNAFDVVSIFIFPRNVSALKGLSKEDFLFIEKKVQEQYRSAKIDWKSPIKEFLKKD
jgi:hypothetical protein